MKSDAGQYLVRYRGRTSGPFSVSDLERMTARGQISRFHEISIDGRSWSAASSLCGKTAAVGGSAAPTSAPSPFDAAGDSELVPVTGDELSREVLVSVERAWYYENRDGEQGPVTESDLVSMIRSGEVGARTPVWTEGMGDWTALKHSSLRDQLSGAANTVAGVGGATGARTPRWLWILAGTIAVSALVGVLVWRFMPQGATSTIARALTPESATAIRSVTDADVISQTVGLVVVGIRAVAYDGRLAELPLGTGSAFAIGADGEMLTNKHIVEPYRRMERASQLKADLKTKAGIDVEERLWVFIAGQKRTARVLWVSDDHDIAIVKVEYQFSHRFRLDESMSGLLDQDVRAIGFPGLASKGLSEAEAIRTEIEARVKQVDPPEDVSSHFRERDLQFTLTAGRVSQIANDTATNMKWIQHTARMSPGNSGGPLVAVNGVVLGINSNVATDDLTNAESSRAIAVGQFRKEIDSHVRDAMWSNH